MSPGNGGSIAFATITPLLLQNERLNTARSVIQTMNFVRGGTPARPYSIRGDDGIARVGIMVSTMSNPPSCKTQLYKRPVLAIQVLI